MIHKVKSVKTYQYVPCGNKNSTHFEVNDKWGPFEISYDDEKQLIMIQQKEGPRYIPLTNVQYFDLIVEETLIEKPRRGRPPRAGDGAEATA